MLVSFQGRGDAIRNKVNCPPVKYTQVRVPGAVLVLASVIIVRQTPGVAKVQRLGDVTQQLKQI